MRIRFPGVHLPRYFRQYAFSSTHGARRPTIPSAPQPFYLLTLSFFYPRISFRFSPIVDWLLLVVFTYTCLLVNSLRHFSASCRSISTLASCIVLDSLLRFSVVARRLQFYLSFFSCFYFSLGFSFSIRPSLMLSGCAILSSSSFYPRIFLHCCTVLFCSLIFSTHCRSILTLSFLYLRLTFPFESSLFFSVPFFPLPFFFFKLNFLVIFGRRGIPKHTNANNSSVRSRCRFSLCRKLEKGYPGVSFVLFPERW